MNTVEKELKRMSDGGCPGIVTGEFALQIERERDEVRRHLSDARFAHSVERDEMDKLREVCDLFALKYLSFPPYDTELYEAYNSLPHKAK